MDVKEKLQELVNTHGEIVEKEGNSHISTCNHYSWDQDVWNHRHEIMGALIKRGYHVSSKTNHGVLDIYIVKPIMLE
tara:strand:+ start:10991 stop:11221 length:231 start_codon:yes stop_codon:yes gene_type:complete